MLKLKKIVQSKLLLYTAVGLVAFVGACTGHEGDGRGQARADATDGPQMVRFGGDNSGIFANERTMEIREEMDLEHKVGQMLMVSFADPEGADAVELIRDLHAGGIILFRDNIQTEQQVTRLTGLLQEEGGSDSGGVGLLIATDQEGGTVQRIGPPICPAFPSNATRGANHDVRGVRDQAVQTAEVFHRLGINMNLAPVLDVLTDPQSTVIGTRSYGSDPLLVAELGCAYIQALQESGIIATAKHFPGHGATRIDSHEDLPVVSTAQEEAIRTHFYPFEQAIAPDVGVSAIMTAHMVYTAFDNVPATLSRVLLQSQLRERMGFEGVIITDSLSMGAITGEHSLAEAACMAVEAGADIVLLIGDAEQLGAVYESLVSRARTDPEFAARVDESVDRILLLKERYGMI